MISEKCYMFPRLFVSVYTKLLSCRLEVV